MSWKVQPRKGKLGYSPSRLQKLEGTWSIEFLFVLNKNVWVLETVKGRSGFYLFFALRRLILDCNSTFIAACRVDLCKNVYQPIPTVRSLETNNCQDSVVSNTIWRTLSPNRVIGSPISRNLALTRPSSVGTAVVLAFFFLSNSSSTSWFSIRARSDEYWPSSTRLSRVSSDMQVRQWQTQPLSWRFDPDSNNNTHFHSSCISFLRYSFHGRGQCWSSPRAWTWTIARHPRNREHGCISYHSLHQAGHYCKKWIHLLAIGQNWMFSTSVLSVNHFPQANTLEHSSQVSSR